MGIRSKVAVLLAVALSLAACRREPRAQTVKTLEDAATGESKLVNVG